MKIRNLREIIICLDRKRNTNNVQCISKKYCLYQKEENMNTNPQTTTTPTKFWMVKTGTSGNSSANIHHATKEIAMEECQRIAKQQPNKKVYLLEVMSCFEVIDIPVKEVKL